MPNWEEIRKEFESSKITLAALAEKHGIKLGTLKSRKSREGWSRGSPKKDATKNKKVATVEPVIESTDLTDKQELFCLYYIKYFNATKAYQKAYECAYSTAMVNGHGLLRNPKIATEIERLKRERQQGIFLEAQDILQKYIDIAFADITDFVEFGREEVLDDLGNPFEVNRVKFKESTEVDGTLITEVKQGKDGVSVKLADKMKALEMLSKYFDLLSENDKKRLQEEKLKAETAKAKAEAERLSKENTVDDLEEIVIVDEWSDDDDN
ncbi:terminase small subunit [Robertmurraya siralis]|uniref:terminase small subunit n=1 Tax=Robertmurraya siralis TaxID=77777 RepID=UPI0010F6188B|nr:terminase small subunit [Robertmurraya siralis]